ncbi:MAG: hypothetical protein DI606_01855 [Sphingobium sp.]|nr:MAG: hypothetical protein DI606_01855 [Sphingobium sp.]
MRAADYPVAMHFQHDAHERVLKDRGGGESNDSGSCKRVSAAAGDPPPARRPMRTGKTCHGFAAITALPLPRSTRDQSTSDFSVICGQR